MPVTLTNIRPFAIRAIGVAGIAAAAAVITPLTVASADDQALPGAPTIRSSSQGVTNGGPSEVRASQRGTPTGGVTPNSDGGGLVQGGNAFAPAGVGNTTLCGTDALVGYGKHSSQSAAIIDCGSDFIPYN